MEMQRTRGRGRKGRKGCFVGGCLLHMATTFEDQEVLKQLFVFINDPVTISHEFC